jgi:hypothetical protein
MFITSDKRVQVVDFGSLITNPMYIGNVHLASGGRVTLLIIPATAQGQHPLIFKHNSHSPSMRKS